MWGVWEECEGDPHRNGEANQGLAGGVTGERHNGKITHSVLTREHINNTLTINLVGKQHVVSTFFPIFTNIYSNICTVTYSLYYISSIGC